MSDSYNTNNTHTMKSIIKLLGGASLGMLATPVLVGGEVAQKTARGLAHTANALNNVGEDLELRGLKMKDSGAERVAAAKVEFNQTRAERAAQKAATKAQRAADQAAYRARRRQELEVAATLRRQLAELSESQLNELTRHELAVVNG